MRLQRLFLSAALLPLAPGGLWGRHIIQEGAVAPPFTLSDLEGKKFSLGGKLQKPVVLLFVRPDQSRSTAACKEAVLLTHSVTNRPWELCVVVSGRFTQQAIERFRKESSFAGHLLLDPDMKVYGAYGAIVTPSTVLVNRGGKVAFSRAGYDFEFSTLLEAHLRHVLGLITEAERDRLIEKGRTMIGAHHKTARLLGLARRLRQRGNLTHAEGLVRKALAEDPHSVSAKIELAEVLLAQKKPQEVLGELQGLNKAAERSGPLRLVRGRALLQLGRLEEAEREFLGAALLDPHSGTAHYELGKLYEKQGKKDEAIRELKLAVEKLLESRKN